MDTLPDLRVTIAEGMEALALRQYWDDDRELYLLRGAATLRWCAAREAPSYEEMKANLSSAETALEEAEENIRDLVANVKHAVREWSHADECPAGQLEARVDDLCHCDLDERRKSALAAVA